MGVSVLSLTTRSTNAILRSMAKKKRKIGDAGQLLYQSPNGGSRYLESKLTPEIYDKIRSLVLDKRWKLSVAISLYGVKPESFAAMRKKRHETDERLFKNETIRASKTYDNYLTDNSKSGGIRY